jgi:branched-chain amino acid transport system ATP-binding protein
MALLEIAGLGVQFGNVPALRGVSLSVAAGEAVAVLGANGAGKTTLLRAIMGRVPIAAGTLALDGAAIGGMRTSRLVDRGLSLCPEGRQLFPAMSVEDNLLLGAHRAGRPAARLRLAAIYDRFPWLGERRRVLAGAFSGGEQQIVAIGRALMAAPRLLLLDEPSSGLSPVAIGRVRELLGQVRAGGTAILLVEQNVQLAAAMTGRAYVLNRGVIEAAGETAALVESTALADAYLGGAA